jgi:hypothetical protein
MLMGRYNFKSNQWCHLQKADAKILGIVPLRKLERVTLQQNCFGLSNVS